MIGRWQVFGSLSLVIALLVRPQQQPARPLLGFSAEGARAERALEARFDAIPSPDSLREHMRRLSARPHHLGSPYGKENADFLAGLFRSWGYDVAIERFDVLFPTPKERVLEMVAPTKFTAKLAEPALPQDASSQIKQDVLPTYNAYSIDGDVTGELVYVNYGVPADYDVLAAHGVDVKGKIVIARYGGSWRGIKPKVAAEHGAIGCIIYSDPRDDGYFQGLVYPQGAYRPPLGAQRGSVEDMPLYPGDPLTPGVGATPDAKRLPRDQSPVLTKIPVLPIGYADAQPLLAALSGAVVPPEWRGALPITYQMGPGPARVHLKLSFNWNMVPAYDVIARVRGAELPDEWVVRGNHHDGWVFGAADPISGQVAMLEEARAIGQLMKSGWRPKRTIIFCAWDGEEPGLLGSTEWAESHADELRQHVVAYINTDSNGRGFLGVGGSGTLERFVNEIAKDVIDPETRVSVGARVRARMRVDGDPGADAADLPISALGSGSDYTAFLQHLGIASLNIGFGGENGGGSYHSVYDTFDHYLRFDDSTFVYGVALAQVAGRAVLRLAQADVMPLRFGNFARHVARYTEEIEHLADDLRKETDTRNALLAGHAYTLAADPKERYMPPDSLSPVPHLNFAPLENAVDRLTAAARRYDSVLAAVGVPSDARTAAALNDLLMRSERVLTREAGLPRRPWFTHLIYAPGFYTGYGVKTLPGIREAVEQRDWKEAMEQESRVADVLDAMSGVIEQATGRLGG
jgi:N-acetylated-alpha-linked acidic dipeptidase